MGVQGNDATVKFEALGDDTLEAEVMPTRKLLALMEQGAPQGTLYGAF